MCVDDGRRTTDTLMLKDVGYDDVEARERELIAFACALPTGHLDGGFTLTV